MSNSVDKRIVYAKFDNSEFDSNIDKSNKSIKEFKKNADFKDVEKASESMAKASKDIDFKNAEKTAKSFSKLDLMKAGFWMEWGRKVSSAFQNVIGSVTNLGKQLSIGQISQGFGKYEDKTSSVQTIMAATGLTIEEVSEQLKRLNWFTDETSYSFTDMVSNIGKFTSMNIPLDKSVTAMQGIANWAAISGQNAQSASRAMYNLAQAIGTGSVKLIDWKSIENANMATAEFKQTVIDTAKELGVLKKNGKFKGQLITTENFNSTLSKGWFNSDVLLAALDKYGEYSTEVYQYATENGVTAAEAMAAMGDEIQTLGSRAFRAAQEAKTFTEAINATKDAVSTGWMNSFEIIFGNYDKAKRFWTDVSMEMWDIFAGGAEDRNQMLEDWAELGGRDSFVNSFLNSLKALKSVLETVKSAFSEVFAELDSNSLYQATLSFEKITENLILSEDGASTLKSVFKALFSVLKLIGSVLKAIAKVTGTVIKAMKPFIDVVVELIVTVSNFITTLVDKVVAMEGFKKVLGVVSTVFGAIAKVLTKIFSFLTNSVQNIGDVCNKLGNNLSRYLGKVENFFSNVWKHIQNIGKKIAKKYEEIKKNAEKIVFNIGKIDTTPIDNFGEHVAGAFKPFEAVIAFVMGVFATAKVIFDKCAVLIKKAGMILYNAVDWALDYILDIVNNRDAKKLIAWLSGGVLTLLVKKILDLKKGTANLKPVVEALEDFFDSLTGVFKKIKAENVGKTAALIGAAILEIAVALSMLALVDPISLAISLGFLAAAVFSFTTMLAVSSKFLAKAADALSSGGIRKIILIYVLLKSLTVMILALAAALKIVSTIDLNKLWQSVGALVSIIGTMGITMLSVILILKTFMGTVKTAGDVAKGATKALKSTAGNETYKAIKQLVKIFMKVAVALLLMVVALKILATIDPGRLWELVGALGALVGMLFGTIGGLLIISKFSGGAAVIKRVNGMLLTFAIVLVGLVYILKIFSKMDNESLTKGLNALLTIMAALSLSLGVIIKAASGFNTKELLSISLLIATIGTSIIGLTYALAILSAIDGKSLAKGIMSLLFLIIAFEAMIINISLLFDGQSAEKVLALAAVASALGACVLMLGTALTLVASLPVDQAWNAFAIILGLMGLVAIFVNMLVPVVKTITKISPDLLLIMAIALGFSAAILILSAAMYVMATAFTILANIPAAELWIAVGAIAATIGVLTVIVLGIAWLWPFLDGAILSILKFGAAMLLLVAIMPVLALIVSGLYELNKLVDVRTGVEALLYILLGLGASALVMGGIAYLLGLAGPKLLIGAAVFVAAIFVLKDAVKKLIAIFIALGAAMMIKPEGENQKPYLLTIIDNAAIVIKKLFDAIQPMITLGVELLGLTLGFLGIFLAFSAGMAALALPLAISLISIAITLGALAGVIVAVAINFDKFSQSIKTINEAISSESFRNSSEIMKNFIEGFLRPIADSWKLIADATNSMKSLLTLFSVYDVIASIMYKIVSNIKSPIQIIHDITNIVVEFNDEFSKVNSNILDLNADASEATDSIKSLKDALIDLHKVMNDLTQDPITIRVVVTMDKNIDERGINAVFATGSGNSNNIYTYAKQSITIPNTNNKNSDYYEKAQNGNNIYNFTQNNYSPKALTNTEIYRQTKNQFSTFRDETNNDQINNY